MSERDVLDGLRGMCNTIDYALASGVSPAYPDTSIRSVIGRAADALAESLAEVDRLRETVLDDAVALYHRALEERDEARAEVERLRRDLAEAQKVTQAIERIRNDALAAIERVPADGLRALDGGERRE